MAENITNLKEARDILAEMQDMTTRYNDGLKAADGYTKKMAKNNAETLKAAISLREEGKLSQKQLGSIADLSKKINAGEIDTVKSKRMQANLEAKLLIAKQRGYT